MAYHSNRWVADEKCAKFYKLGGNYSVEFRVRAFSPQELYVPIIICFIIGILTYSLPPDRDDVTIIPVFLRRP